MSSLNRKPNRNRWVLTPERVGHLNACAAQGMPLAAAARELNVLASTIKDAAYREDKDEWLRERFPRKQGKGGGAKRAALSSRPNQSMRKLKPEQIDAPLYIPGGPQMRWLAKEWRVAV